MFWVKNRTYTSEWDFFGWFLLNMSITRGIFTCFFFSFYKITALINQAINQTKNKEVETKQNKMKKNLLKREREIHFVPVMTIDCITEKEVGDHQKMSENCCVDSMPLPDRTSYYRKPEFSFESEFGFRFIRN